MYTLVQQASSMFQPFSAIITEVLNKEKEEQNYG